MQTINDTKYVRKIEIDEETKNILNDIAMSLRIMSGRSKVTNISGKNSYKDFYFSPSVTEDEK